MSYLEDKGYTVINNRIQKAGGSEWVKNYDHIVSLDPAQAHDYFAIAVIKLVENKYLLEGLVRFRHTSYVDACTRIMQVVNQLKGRVAIVCDAGGPGLPVISMLEPEGIDLYPVFITGGHQAHLEPGKWSIPKALLVYNMITLLEHGNIIIPKDLKLGKEARKEFETFRSRPSSPDSNTLSYESLHSKDSYDDLVLSIIVGSYVASQVFPAVYTSPANQIHIVSIRADANFRDFGSESMSNQEQDLIMSDPDDWNAPREPTTNEAEQYMRGHAEPGHRPPAYRDYGATHQQAAPIDSPKLEERFYNTPEAEDLYPPMTPLKQIGKE